MSRPPARLHPASLARHEPRTKAEVRAELLEEQEMLLGSADSVAEEAANAMWDRIAEIDRLLADLEPEIDPRDPDPSRVGIFRDHNCWKCADGTKPCVVGNPRQCEYPYARND